MLFLKRLQEHREKFPEKLAIEFRGTAASRKINYEDLLESSGRAAAWLDQLGVGPGDRVAICLSKSLACVQLHLAACGMGAVSMPLNPSYSSRELEYLLRDSEAELLVIAQRPKGGGADMNLARDLPTRIVLVDPDRFEDLLPPQGLLLQGIPIEPEQTALMLYTSGTTGRPKGACLSHANLTANMDMLGEAWQWSEDDVLLHSLPLFHVHGLLVALHGALHAGASSIVHSAFEASSILKDLRTNECTVFMAVPTMYRRLLDAAGEEPTSLRHLRLLTSGSDRLPVETFRRIEEQFGVRVVERYGMTETGIMLSNPLDGERRPGQVGIPLPGIRMRVVNRDTMEPSPVGEVGELQTLGPHVFAGYWKDPGKMARSFAKDGWFRTGDLGRCNSDGRYELKGRMSDLIITGGFNVYPAEVEHVLTAHPDVDQCAVVGVPDEQWGEAVTAFVVRRDVSVGTETLLSHCRNSLAAYKLPKRIIDVESLPRNAMGKVQKTELRAAAIGKRPPGGS